jgi:serine/threonine-protein kinase SRPK3
VRVGEKFKDGRYVVLRKLGWGHFSTVWLAEEVETGRTFALKVRTSQR